MARLSPLDSNFCVLAVALAHFLGDRDLNEVHRASAAWVSDEEGVRGNPTDPVLQAALGLQQSSTEIAAESSPAMDPKMQAAIQNVVALVKVLPRRS